MSRDINIF